MHPFISKRRRRACVLAGVTVVLGLGVLALPFLPVPDPPLSGWGGFLGRFHPLVVHFPVVLVLVLLLMEGLARMTGRESLRQAVPVLLVVAVLGSVGAAASGYLLYASDDYGGALLRRHLWGGVALALVMLATGVLYAAASTRRGRRAYLAALLVANGLVVYTAHLGGSLTHGTAFLTGAFPGWGAATVAAEAVPPEELRVFDDLLMPAFEARCLQCHSPEKAKGELVMTSLERLRQGGESGATMLVAGDPQASELYRRVTLPVDHEDRMPPEGKPGLDEDEAALLRWWIAAGADAEMRLGAGPEDPALQAAVARYLPRLVRTQRRRLRDRKERQALARELDAKARGWGLVIEPDPETDSTLFGVSMRLPPERVTDEVVAALRPYAEAFSRLSLVSSEVTDEALYHLAPMRNLRALFLQKSRIDGSGLAYLKALPALQVLNLSHTRLGDAGALHLVHLPALERVYLYNTEVSPAVLEALRAHRPDVELLEVEGPYY